MGSLNDSLVTRFSSSLQRVGYNLKVLREVLVSISSARMRTHKLSIDRARTSDGNINSVRIFVSNPRRKGTRIRSTESDDLASWILLLQVASEVGVI